MLNRYTQVRVDTRQMSYTAFRAVSREAVAYRKTKLTYERLAELNPVPPLLVIFGIW
jgi:hypothetical protein